MHAIILVKTMFRAFERQTSMRSILLSVLLALVPQFLLSQEAEFDCKMEIFVDVSSHWGLRPQRLEDFSFKIVHQTPLDKIVFDGKSTWFGSSEFHISGNPEHFNTVFSEFVNIVMNREYFNHSHTSAIATQAILAKCHQRRFSNIYERD
jgi:hypothetical protein